MLPEFSCNLLEALPLPPWKGKLDWSLHTTRKWERRIPFPSYVRRTTSTTTDSLKEQTTVFLRFTSLPVELQLRIFGFCSACTLFQLMHVSSAVRIEASKLFWANPATYFLVDASWLLDGGYPGYQCYDLAFMQNVQNIEIEYEPSTNSDICPRRARRDVIRQDRIAAFWDSVKQRFPSARSVVINQNGESGLWRSDGAVPRPLRILLQAHPCTLQASALVSERQDIPDVHGSTLTQPVKTWKRALYQMVAGDVWQKQEYRRRDTVLLPMKHWAGPAGEFERLKRQCFLVELQQYGLWPLAIEALDRYHFDCGKNEPFSCLWAGCDAYFKTPGAWTVHAAETHYQHPSQFSILPNEIKTLFEERARSLEASNRQVRMQFKRIKEEWNNVGENKQKEMKRAWRAQLGEGEGAFRNVEENTEEDRLWREFVQWTSPTWDCY